MAHAANGSPCDTRTRRVSGGAAADAGVAGRIIRTAAAPAVARFMNVRIARPFGSKWSPIALPGAQKRLTTLGPPTLDGTRSTTLAVSRPPDDRGIAPQWAGWP